MTLSFHRSLAKLPQTKVFFRCQSDNTVYLYSLSGCPDFPHMLANIPEIGYSEIGDGFSNEYLFMGLFPLGNKVYSTNANGIN